jgi:dUTP pyrophosphatase
MNLKITKLNPAAILPKYEHPDDSGLDLSAIENLEIPGGESRLVKTGLSIQLPPNTEAQIRPRSGLALKHQITVLNTPGTVDEGYRGEIGVILINHSKNTFKITTGMRIAQMVIAPVIRVQVEEVRELTDTHRGSGGFGSTGGH